MVFSTKDWEDLRWAKERLERPRVAGRLARMFRGPAKVLTRPIPPAWRERVDLMTQEALLRGIDWVLGTLDIKSRSRESIMHLAGSAAAGAAGGFFGAPVLPVELPAVTLMTLRSIANIACVHGEDMDEMEARLQCLAVLALGGGRSAGDNGESAYYATRMAMAEALGKMAESLADEASEERTTGAVLQLINKIAARFGARISEGMAASAIPVIGAGSGAAINGMFMHEVQTLGEAHFTVRRLERRHGKDAVKDAYRGLRI